MADIYFMRDDIGRKLLVPLENGQYVAFHLSHSGQPHFGCVYSHLPSESDAGGEGVCELKQVEMPGYEHPIIRNLFSDFKGKHEAAERAEAALNAAAAGIMKKLERE